MVSIYVYNTQQDILIAGRVTQGPLTMKLLLD